jgi:hypothetical protein
MVGIGLRVYSNSAIYYAIFSYEGETLVYHDISSLTIPVSLEKPEQLTYVRNTLLDIIDQYEICRAVIRLSEMTGTYNLLAIERHFCEGVIQESFASSTVEKFKAGRIAELARILDMPREDFKKYTVDGDDFEVIPKEVKWKKLSKEERESVMACICSLKL